jgi:uncharacterized membrane protein YfcA
MVFGSFIAGSSSEGGGAVAFPVMTLIFDFTPQVARNFSLAIQSIGMTAASYFIILKKVKVEFRYLIPVSIGGCFGIMAGTSHLVPYVHGPFAKMLFVTFWLSFAIVLFYINKIFKRDIIDELPRLSITELILLVIVGFLGGGLSSIIGSGIDILSFAYVTMRYHLSEKVATPTSVIIMAINSIVGFTMHACIINDFGSQEFNFWLVSIPVVIFGAPFGAYFINNKTRGFIANFLYWIIGIQFISALIIIQPSGQLLWFTIVAFLLGLSFFFGFTRIFR